MRATKLLPAAEQELLDSARFYEEKSAGLGNRLLEDFRIVMERLETYPESGPRISKRLRVARLSDFPYNVIYHVESDHILVVAIAHQSRRPGYWKGRI